MAGVSVEAIDVETVDIVDILGKVKFVSSAGCTK